MQSALQFKWVKVLKAAKTSKKNEAIKLIFRFVWGLNASRKWTAVSE